MRRLRHTSLIVSLVLAVGASAPGAIVAAPTNHTTPTHSGSFRFFSPRSVWNTIVPVSARIDPNSAGIVSQLTALYQKEELMKNGPWINYNQNAAAFIVVGRHQRTVKVRLDHAPDAALSAAWSAVPLPARAHPSPGDNVLAVWQPSTDKMWEFIGLKRLSDGWHANWGGAMQHVSTNPGVYGPDAWPGAKDWWGVTATSMPLVAGGMTLEELARGRINHALAMAVPNVRWATYASPAHRDDGNSHDPNSMPEGAHLRIDPKLDLSKLDMPPLTRMMAEAAQRYGVIVRDYSPNIAFFAQDPSNAASHVYALHNLMGGLYPTQLLASFPWSRLQVLKMELHTGW